MCYDISYLTRRQIDYAKRYGREEDVEEIRKRLPPVYHTSGFDHTEAPIVVMEDEPKIKLFEWGLIPWWTKSATDAVQISNRTINARGETIFQKPAFKSSATEKRCLILVDGFYEYHHYKGKAYPYYISRTDEQPFTIGGLWDQWNDKENGVVRYTFSLITTDANERMSVLHNNPKVLERGGPRMPFVVPYDLEKTWLDTSLPENEVLDLIKPYPANELKDHTVRPLRGKFASGNQPIAREFHHYAELDAENQGDLFG